jgi:spermidine synthase
LTLPGDVNWNTDSQPAAYFYHMLLWNRMSARGEGGSMEGLTKIQNKHILGGAGVILGVVLLIYLIRSGLRKGIGRSAITWSIAGTGLANMGLVIVLMFAFQNLYGYVYQRIALIVAVFMVGLVIGSTAMNICLRRRSGWALAALIFIDLLVIVLAILMPEFLSFMGSLRWAWGGVEAATMGMVCLVGILGGGAWPAAARLHASLLPEAGRTAAAIDAADHVGGVCGALLTGVLIIPLLGTVFACQFMAVVKLAGLVLLLATALLIRRKTAR